LLDENICSDDLQDFLDIMTHENDCFELLKKETSEKQME